jgi:hypothetical protein
MNAHKAMNPAIMAAAVPSNRRGVGVAYGHAAEWLRRGEAPPPELCEWLAERLSAVGVALRNMEDDKPDAAVMCALGARESKRGRKPADEDKRDRDVHLAWEVMTRHTNEPEKKMAAIFEEVAATWPIPRDNVTAATVKAAWERHGSDLIPE